MPNHIVVVTGGSRGIGLSFAKTLLGAGWRVLLTAARDGEALEKAVAELADQHGVEAVAGILADAGTLEGAERSVAATLDRFGQIDALVNNAGRGPREISESFPSEPPKFWETTPSAWDEIVRSNVNGPFLMARAAAPHMIAAGWGRIVNISTSQMTMVRKGFAPYGPSKAALDAMTRIFAQDLEGTGVTVNTLLPGGATDTSFIPGAGPGRRGADGNLLPVDIMNAALLWLLSSKSNGVTAGRFVGAKWVSEDDPDAAREDTGAPPLIL